MAYEGCYKYCFVPMCTNTTNLTPEKWFITIPANAKDKKKWMVAARRTTVPTGTLYCCEDHFDIENEVENYMKYVKMFKGHRRTRIRLKPGVIPTKFECQTSRLVTGRKTSHVSVRHKLERKQIIRKLLEESNSMPQVPLVLVNEMDQFENDESEASQNYEGPQENELVEKRFLDKGVQIQPRCVSKEVQARPRFKSKYVQAR